MLPRWEVWNETRHWEHCETKGKGIGSLFSSPKRNSTDERKPKGTSLSGKEFPPTWYDFKKGAAQRNPWRTMKRRSLRLTSESKVFRKQQLSKKKKRTRIIEKVSASNQKSRRQKIETYKPFTQESTKVIHNLENVGHFESCGISSKIQCSYCAKYLAEGVVNDILWDLFDAYIVYETSWPRSEDVLTERSQAQWYRESQQAFGWTEDICRYLHQIEKDKLCIAPERWAGKSSSNFTEPSYSPKAVSRKAMEIEYLVSSFFFVGMERIAILVEFSKDGYQWIYISYNEFRLQDIVITPHRARFTRANIFSRVVQAYMLHLFVCFSQNNHLHERLSCFAFSWSRFFSSTLSSPISSSSLLDPSNMANVCAIPQVCLAVLPNRFRSHFLHRRQPSQWHRFSRQRLVRMSFARQIRFSWARNVFFSTARQEMPHFGYYDKVDIMVETRRLCRTNNLELTQSIEVYTEFVARKLGMWSQFQTLLKELFSKEGKHLFRPSNTTILEEVLAPLLNCHSEDRQFIVDSGASLQMTSKSATTIIKSKEFVVIMTTKGMSGSTDVFLSLWCWCKVHGRFYFWVSIIDEMLKKV